jgi:spore coat protein X
MLSTNGKFTDHNYYNRMRPTNNHCSYNEYGEKNYYREPNNNADVMQDADQLTNIDQESTELIFIKDSCNITVHSTDTQAAVSLQVGLQLAIALVIKIILFDSDEGENVSQDLLQYFDTEQTNKQKIVIENSKDITVTTTDTDVSVNIQALLQVLITLIAKLDIA